MSHYITLIENWIQNKRISIDESSSRWSMVLEDTDIDGLVINEIPLITELSKSMIQGMIKSFKEFNLTSIYENDVNGNCTSIYFEGISNIGIKFIIKLNGEVIHEFSVLNTTPSDFLNNLKQCEVLM